jgi:hypothetical protein
VRKKKAIELDGIIMNLLATGQADADEHPSPPGQADADEQRQTEGSLGKKSDDAGDNGLGYGRENESGIF